MASIGWEGKRARILFRDENGKQKSLRMGECTKSMAQTACTAVGHLVIAKRHNGVPHSDAVRWLSGIDDVLHSRVAALGLCQPRANAAVVTLGTLLERFVEATTVKEGTKYKYEQVVEGLREHLGASTPLADITPAHADGWRKAIAEPTAVKGSDGKEITKQLARATVAKRIVIAKGVFHKAVRWGMLARNPFADLRAGSQHNPDRTVYVTRANVMAVLDACPDDEWRAIIALCRYAGLRCPSELVGLTWGDVNWERSRLTVRSPKTEGHGEAHAVRVVPIGPELRPILLALFDAAEPGTPAAQWIIPRLRDPSMNLRTTFEKIIARAGVQPWPRLFHNLRGSCATDWCERFPAHVVAGWLGHSPTIAAKHYLSTRDAHFDLAAGVGQAGDSCQMATATNPATEARQSDPKRAQADSENIEKPPVLAGVGARCDSVENGEVPPVGLEPTTR